MIVAAGVLVLVGAGFFAAGIATGTTAFHWSCVGACAAAGVLLAVARVRAARRPPHPAPAAAARRGPAEPPASTQPPGPVAEAHGPPTPRAAGGAGGDPPVEDAEVTDLLLVVDLPDEVLVVDGHARYHVAGCPWLAGRETLPLPVLRARADGFTPCARCAPDRTLAERERGRRRR